MATKKLFSQDIRSLPKVELHRHLDCSVRWSTLIELAPHAGIELAQTTKEQMEQFLILNPMKDLATVLTKFTNSQKILCSEEILTRVAYEACEDAFNDGIRILELRYAPTFIMEGHSFLNFNKIHRALEKGIELAKKRLPLAAGLICIVQRTKSIETATEVVNFAIDNKGSFIGLDLADNEEGFDPKKFAPLFQRAKKEGLHITVHSGETPTNLAATWVKDSIEVLGAERIGHGVQIVRDKNILEFVRNQKIPLEVCPISNYLTQAFPSYDSHPIRQLINSGIIVTINSDDPGIFGTKLSDDYQVLNQTQNFTLEEFVTCNQLAFEASFIPENEKEKFRSDFF